MSNVPLQFTNVTKKFSENPSDRKALDNISFTLQPGNITGLIGPDGAGKTTIIRLAVGLLLPNTGKVFVLGMDTAEKTAQIQTQISYMPQHFGLYEDLTVSENFNLYANLQGLNAQENVTRQQQLLKLTGLGPFTNRRCSALSGGMKQKLGLGCALLRSPKLLILDEPTVGVDPISRQELWSIVHAIKKEGGTVLISTAYFDEAEKCDEIILLHEGKLHNQQTPKKFREPLINRTYFVNDPHISRRMLVA